MNMRELINWLNERTKEYDEGHPTVSDKEWDNKFFELVKMEEENHYAEKDSPTQRVNWDAVSALTKVNHNHPMLSLAKTKDKEEFINYFSNIDSSKDIIAMLKLDGLTCSLRYVNGQLISAETRGNGEVGEDITHNAKVNYSIPNYISYKDELIIDGEIICTYGDFYYYDEKNGGKYKNPRNFASGKIRSLNPTDSHANELTFIAWNVIKGFEDTNSFCQKLDRLRKLDFFITPYTILNGNWEDFLKNEAEKLSYPIDGLVGRFDDIEFGGSLGSTGHHSKAAYAFKFYDEEYDSKLLSIKWSMGRTGILTPVAIFEPIDIDGTTVERASLHNLSVMKDIMGDCCWLGQPIKVYKSNMIIPQIKSAMKMNYGDVISKGGITVDGFSGELLCPCCGGETAIEESEAGVQNLVCQNPNCDGKLINILDHFCGKKGLDIKGLSKMTLEKLIDWGWINSRKDIFNLSEYRSDWIQMSGFGIKSVDNILNAIEKAKTVKFANLISAFGIELIGLTVAKDLSKKFNTYEDFRRAIDEDFDFSQYDGYGYEMNKALNNFDYAEMDYIVENYLTIVYDAATASSTPLEGLTFVITGKLSKKRDDIKADIESLGGKVTGSVSSKTSYLVCNDKESNTGKSKDAKKLGIPIITEEELYNLG